MKIKEILNYGIELLKKNNIEDSSIVAKLLAQKLLNLNKAQLVIKYEEEISENLGEQYKIMINKIIEGTPLQYITNEQYFYGIKFYVDENVLIPQPDTEILVEEAINVISSFKDKKNIKILDMCTGSGCIGISLAKKIKKAKVTVVDISHSALEIATKNAKENNVNIEIIESDMFKDIKEKYDVIVSNPPYIETSIIKKLSKEVQNEPHLALDGGEDGLEFYRIIANNAYNNLNDGGYLLMEIGFDQRQAVTKILEETQQYKNIYLIKDLSGNDRVLVCHKKKRQK